MEFDILKATILAVIQGLTEFLPISSSAHLILPSALFGWEDQGLAFDVAVHLGTLSAVVIYFRHDVYRIARALILNLVKKEKSRDSDLAWALVVATLPVIIVGYLLKDFVDQYLRATVVIATTTILFGLLLWQADRKHAPDDAVPAVTLKTALIIGLAQVLSLLPGTSRSGITMTAALFCKMSREESSRFSFLLSIPVIAGAAFLLGLDLLEHNGVNWGEIGYGILLAGITAYCCIYLFLHAINRMGFTPFVIYRLILGTVLFLFFV